MKHRRENKTATRTAPALRTRCCPSGQHSEEEHHPSGLSRNFVGNHCNKYIQQATTENICQSVVRKVKWQITTTYSTKHMTSQKNTSTWIFSVHKCTSSYLTHSPSQLRKLAWPGTPSKTAWYSSETSSHISKSHLLEAQCIDFLRACKIGLGLCGRRKNTCFYQWTKNKSARGQQSCRENQNLNERTHDHCMSTPTVRDTVGKAANKVRAHTPCTPSPSPTHSSWPL